MSQASASVEVCALSAISEQFASNPDLRFSQPFEKIGRRRRLFTTASKPTLRHFIEKFSLV